MEPSAHDRSTIEKYLATARERLRALRDVFDAGGAEVGALRVAVASVLGALDDAHAIVADPREVQRVACPHCGYRVMPGATLCLSCWRKLTPTKTS